MQVGNPAQQVDGEGKAYKTIRWGGIRSMVFATVSVYPIRFVQDLLGNHNSASNLL